VALRIAFDLDGVLADMAGRLAREAERLFPRKTPSRPSERFRAPATLQTAQSSDSGTNTKTSDAGTAADGTAHVAHAGLTWRQQRRLWRHVESIDDFWQSLEEIEPGIIAQLAAVAASRRWEVVFLTKRSDTLGATAQVQSQRWLESNGFPLPSVHIILGSRGLVAAALGLDVVIDDRPEACLDVVADSKARAILICRDHDETIVAASQRLGIVTAQSVRESLEILAALDERQGSERRRSASRHRSDWDDPSRSEFFSGSVAPRGRCDTRPTPLPR
jgi:hypothetical protein